MNSTYVRFTFPFVVCSVLAAMGQTCRGDLFALMTGSGGIVRMNSTTGAVIDTYPTTGFLFPQPISVDTGLAFDGRNLYLNLRTNQGFEELWMFNLATEQWIPAGILETFSIDPLGTPERITGLGYMTDAFGQPALAAVTRREGGNAHIVQYVLAPPFVGTFPTLPAGELPAAIDPRGLDFDPGTGELWMTAFEGSPSGLPTLKQIDLDGTILQTLPVPDDIPFYRGVGFDGGGLFIAGRSLIAGEETVYQLDRTTGAVLNSFVITGPGMVAALTGGTVVPEPTGVVLAISLLLVTMSRRPTAG